MRQRLAKALRRLRSDRGSFFIGGVLLSLLVLTAGGFAVDYSRAAGLQRKLQQATDVAAREAVRGKGGAELTHLVRGQLDAYMRQMGYSDGAKSVTVNINRDGPRVGLVSTVNYASLFGKLYPQSLRTLAVSTASGARDFCTSAASKSRWVASSASSPAGQTGTITYEQEQVRNASCTSETSETLSWGEWSDTGTERNRVETCDVSLKTCSYAPPSARFSYNIFNYYCPSGDPKYIPMGDIEIVDYHCDLTTGQNVSVRKKIGIGSVQDPSLLNPSRKACLDTYTGSCVPPAAETKWVTLTIACPYGGRSISRKTEQTRTAYCSGRNVLWNDWANTGNVQDTGNCAEPPPPPASTPTCSPAAAQTQWVDRSTFCPVGMTGYNKWQVEQSRSSSCSGSALQWTAWADTGNTRPVTYTCASTYTGPTTPACTLQPAQTQWVDRVDTCPAGETGTNIWQAEETRSSYCSGSAMLWNAWTITGNARPKTYTCAIPCTPQPAQTQWVDRVDTCPAGQVGTNIWQAEETRSSYCSGSALLWTGWSITGAAHGKTYTCAPASTPSQPSTPTTPSTPSTPSTPTTPSVPTTGTWAKVLSLTYTKSFDGGTNGDNSQNRMIGDMISSEMAAGTPCGGTSGACTNIGAACYSTTTISALNVLVFDKYRCQ